MEMVAHDGNGNKIQERFNNEHITNMVYFTDLEFSWEKRKIENTLALKATGMYIYPEFIGLVYKIGFWF